MKAPIILTPEQQDVLAKLSEKRAGLLREAAAYQSGIISVLVALGGEGYSWDGGAVLMPPKEGATKSQEEVQSQSN